MTNRRMKLMKDDTPIKNFNTKSNRIELKFTIYLRRNYEYDQNFETGNCIDEQFKND